MRLEARPGTFRPPDHLPGARIPDLPYLSPGTRLLAGAIGALFIALAARRAGSLSTSGVLAAVICGAVATAAGWRWAALLIAFFVATSILTRIGAGAKQARLGGVVEKGGARDWRQVVANGGVFATGAALWTWTGHDSFAALAGGALAAAAADSWATEIGTLTHRRPRSILTFEPVAPGTSGAVSIAGSLAMVGGSAFVSTVAWALGWSGGEALAAFAGGIGGALADSLLGATLQERRWCAGCSMATEQVVHRCGAPTQPAGGVRLVDNDAVNLACSLAGGLLAVLVAA